MLLQALSPDWTDQVFSSLIPDFQSALTVHQVFLQPCLIRSTIEHKHLEILLHLLMLVSKILLPLQTGTNHKAQV